MNVIKTITFSVDKSLEAFPKLELAKCYYAYIYCGRFKTHVSGVRCAGSRCRVPGTQVPGVRFRVSGAAGGPGSKERCARFQGSGATSKCQKLSH